MNKFNIQCDGVLTHQNKDFSLTVGLDETKCLCSDDGEKLQNWAAYQTKLKNFL